ncbi:MAG: hypothetical protein ABFS03_14080, partial [Chloroflexota bacterium]
CPARPAVDPYLFTVKKIHFTQSIIRSTGICQQRMFRRIGFVAFPTFVATKIYEEPLFLWLQHFK